MVGVELGLNVGEVLVVPVTKVFKLDRIELNLLVPDDMEEVVEPNGDPIEEVGGEYVEDGGGILPNMLVVVVVDDELLYVDNGDDDSGE